MTQQTNHEAKSLSSPGEARDSHLIASGKSIIEEFKLGLKSWHSNSSPPLSEKIEHLERVLALPLNNLSPAIQKTHLNYLSGLAGQILEDDRVTDKLEIEVLKEMIDAAISSSSDSQELCNKMPSRSKYNSMLYELELPLHFSREELIFAYRSKGVSTSYVPKVIDRQLAEGLIQEDSNYLCRNESYRSFMLKGNITAYNRQEKLTLSAINQLLEDCPAEIYKIDHPVNEFSHSLEDFKFTLYKLNHHFTLEQIVKCWPGDNIDVEDLCILFQKHSKVSLASYCLTLKEEEENNVATDFLKKAKPVLEACIGDAEGIYPSIPSAKESPADYKAFLENSLFIDNDICESEENKKIEALRFVRQDSKKYLRPVLKEIIQNSKLKKLYDDKTYSIIVDRLEGRTLSDVGLRHRLSRERARQLIDGSIGKVHPLLHHVLNSRSIKTSIPYFSTVDSAKVLRLLEGDLLKDPKKIYREGLKLSKDFSVSKNPEKVISDLYKVTFTGRQLKHLKEWDDFRKELVNFSSQQVIDYKGVSEYFRRLVIVAQNKKMEEKINNFQFSIPENLINSAIKLVEKFDTSEISTTLENYIMGLVLNPRENCVGIGARYGLSQYDAGIIFRGLKKEIKNLSALRGSRVTGVLNEDWTHGWPMSPRLKEFILIRFGEQVSAKECCYRLKLSMGNYAVHQAKATSDLPALTKINPRPIR